MSAPLDLGPPDLSLLNRKKNGRSAKPSNHKIAQQLLVDSAEVDNGVERAHVYALLALADAISGSVSSLEATLNDYLYDDAEGEE